MSASAIQRFERFHGRPIEVAPETAKLEAGGRFKQDELGKFLRDVRHTLPIVFWSVLNFGSTCLRWINLIFVEFLNTSNQH